MMRSRKHNKLPMGHYRCTESIDTTTDNRNRRTAGLLGGSKARSSVMLSHLD